MTPHALGSELRELVLRERRAGRPLDPRRLQGAIGDLCGGEHADLLTPLRQLVLSATFAKAAAQDPPLGDARLLGPLQEELTGIYAAPLCARLQPVLEGLLGLAPHPSAGTAAAPRGGPPAVPNPPSPSGPTFAGHAGGQPLGTAPAPGVSGRDPAAAPWAPAAASQEAASVRGASGSSPGALVAVLAFLSGVLLMALAGTAFLLWQNRQSSSVPGPATGSGGERATRPQGTPVPPAAPVSEEKAPAAAPAAAPSTPPAVPPAPGTAEATAVDRSLASIQTLYAALSAKDYERARSLFGEAAAAQFEPAFFDQFERVTVQNLQVTSQAGATLNMEGEVNFVYPDGSIQTETRSFTLDSSSDPARITASEFGRVIKPR